MRFWRLSNIPEHILPFQANVVLNLDLNGCSFSSDEYGNVIAIRINGTDEVCQTPTVVDRLLSLENLKTIECSALYGRGKLCNRWLKRLLESTYSGRLFLWGHSDISDDALISSGCGIAELLINGSPLTNRVFQYLQEYKSLNLLQLVDTQIVAVNPNEINAIPNLTKVAFNDYVASSIEHSQLKKSIQVIPYKTN